MDTEDTTKMLTEILEEFIIYMYYECKNEDFNYEFILNNFVECHDNHEKMLHIFNLFNKSIYYNQIQNIIKYKYFMRYDDDDEIYYDDDGEIKFYENELINYQIVTLFITRYYKIELTKPFMINFINSIIDNLQPILK